MPSSRAVLVVEPALPHLLSILSALSFMRLDVRVAETFKDARASIVLHQPSLLLTDVRLQDYNGLHLLLRGRATWPALPAIVAAETPDPMLQDDAEKLGATFLLMPAPREEIAAAVYRTLFRPVVPGVTPEPIRPPFERRGAERRVKAGGAPAVPERRSGNRRREPTDRLAELSDG